MKTLYLPLMFALLAACAADEPLVPPTPLTPLQASMPSSLEWRVKVGKGKQHAASYFVPASADGNVFAANSDGQVVAVQAASGKVLWRRSVAERLSSGVAVDKQHVYVAERDGKLLALNRETGELEWKYTMSSEILAPVAAGFDWVVARSADGRVVGLKAADGVEQWRTAYTPPALTLHGYSSPHIVSGGVLLGLDDGKLVALSSTNGNTLWESQLSYPSGRSEIERLVDLDADIITDDKYIYAANYQGRLARIEPTQGRQVWSVDFSTGAGLAQSGDTLYAIDARDEVQALDKSTGEVLWRQEKLVGRKLTQPVVSGNTLQVADLDGFVHLLSLSDGQLLGRIRIAKKPVSATPIALENGLLVQSTDGRLSRIKTGS